MTMKKFTLIFVFLLMINNTAPVFGSETGSDTIAPPQVDALGAVLMDFNTGRVLWEKNAATPLAMASTTKIMTAILTLENGNLEDIVTVSSKAAAAPEVKMHLKAGEEIKLEFLLYALMLQSFNDSAVAIAEHIGGDVETFCKMMTEKAKELGAVDTVFETPNGLDAGDHHSTAYDMAVITRYALGNEKFMEIINTPYVTVNSNTNTYNLSNKNRLLNELEGANGVKTGFTGKAGHCFVGAAKRGDMQLISVVLASGWGNKGKEQKWVDTKAILNYGFDVFDYHQIIEEQSICDNVLIGRSRTDNTDIYFSEGFMLPLSSDELNNIRIDIDTPESLLAPVEKGQKVGVAKVYINGSLEKEIDLLTSSAAERHDLKTSLEKVFGDWLNMGSNSEIDLVLPELPGNAS